ncbi:helix-turn-helix domain-containing protein [Streptomyces sp. NPDC127051]|uniref:helix-turn-helix domain-containing protein n=1 Tax=Streptomyces sp. NPDC127051 TaxID=3347119 RepID=UPI00366749D2
MQNYSVDEAAEILRCRPSYLRDNLSRLPHQKIGASVAFDEDELEMIKEMHRVRPASQPTASQPIPTAEQTSPNTLPAYAHIKPAGASRRRKGPTARRSTT